MLPAGKPIYCHLHYFVFLNPKRNKLLHFFHSCVTETAVINNLSTDQFLPSINEAKKGQDPVRFCIKNERLAQCW